MCRCGRVAGAESGQRAEAGGYTAVGEHYRERKVEGRIRRVGMPPTRAAAVGMRGWVAFGEWLIRVQLL
jgi:hypothetical protein